MKKFTDFKTTKKYFLISTFCIIQLMVSVAFSQPPIQWEKSLGGSDWDSPNSIIKTNDGGYIVAGETSSINGDISFNNGYSDYWVVKLDASGYISSEKTYGGSMNDYASSIIQTNDGGYAVAGYSYSNDGDVSGNNGNFDYWVIKLDTSYNIVWQKSFGGTDDDEANCIAQAADGGYVVAGYSYSVDGDVIGNNGGKDYWVLKLDSAGTIIWKKCYGGSNNDLANSVVPTSDGGCVLAGRTESIDGDVVGLHGPWTNSDYWVIKLDINGNIIWKKCLGGMFYDWANSIAITTNGGFILAGVSWSADGDITGHHGLEEDYWVVKLDSTGNIQWQKSLGGTGAEYGTSAVQTTDGGYIVTGRTISTDGDVTGIHPGGFDYWTVKLDSSGNITWQKCLGGTASDSPYSIVQGVDGGYVVVGYSSSTDGDVTGNNGVQDFWIVKLQNTAGVIEDGLNDKHFVDTYPNPSDGKFTIINNKLPIASYQLEVYSALGEKVYSDFTFPFETAWDGLLDLSNQPNGIYFLYIKTEKKLFTQKLIIQR